MIRLAIVVVFLTGVHSAGAADCLTAASAFNGEQASHPTDAAAQPEQEAQVLRARLEHRLVETRQLQERLEAAVQRLDEGDSPAEVRADLLMPSGRDWLERPSPPSLDRMGFRRGGERGSRERVERRLSAEEREELAARVREHAPELARRLVREHSERPESADRMLAGMAPRVHLLMAESDEPMRELRRQELHAGWDVVMATRDLVDAARQGADEAQTEELAGSLRTALARHFDIRLAMHEREIAILDERISELRREMEQHVAKREEMVDRRIEALMRMAERRARQHEGRGEDSQR